MNSAADKDILNPGRHSLSSGNIHMSPKLKSSFEVDSSDLMKMSNKRSILTAIRLSFLDLAMTNASIDKVTMSKKTDNASAGINPFVQ